MIMIWLRSSQKYVNLKSWSKFIGNYIEFLNNLKQTCIYMYICIMYATYVEYMCIYTHMCYIHVIMLQIQLIFYWGRGLIKRKTIFSFLDVCKFIVNNFHIVFEWGGVIVYITNSSCENLWCLQGLFSVNKW